MDAIAYPNPDANAHSNRYPHRHTYPEQYTKAIKDMDAIANRNFDQHSHGHPYADEDNDSLRNVYADADGRPQQHAACFDHSTSNRLRFYACPRPL